MRTRGKSGYQPIAITALVTGALLLTGCASTPEAVPITPVNTDSQDVVPPDLSAFYGQDIDWRNCGDADCTTFEVPLDYSDPNGARVTLSMSKVMAEGESIGTLFVNPGGPGGSAFEYAKAADFIVSPGVREVFDVVGVDPRGVGLSDPISCLTDAQTDQIIAADASPDTPLEESRLLLDAPIVGQACEQSGNPLLEHMSTIEVAKDMDIARALVGDPVMNLLGKSYGTAIGTTYLNLFPQRVGRMVLDGVLPLDLDQFEVTEGQAIEFEILLEYFVQDCLTQDDCPLTGTTEDGVNQIQSFLADLDEQPLQGDGDRELTQGLATYAILSYLYFPEIDFPPLRSALNAAMINQDPQPMVDILDSRLSRAPDGTYEDNSQDAFYAVSCLDLPIDATDDQVRTYVQNLGEAAPTFGTSLAWGVVTCRDWPATRSVSLTPTTEPIPPIMIVATEFDPATPAKWGKKLADQLGNAEVVFWEGGYNHTGYLEGSDCVQEVVDSFLIEGIINPGVTTTCN